MAFFHAFKAWTIRHLPWQAPCPLPMTGVPEPRQGLYAMLFGHLQTNLTVYNAALPAGWGHLSHSYGDSNRPTMIGENELVYVSYRYRGGRGVRIGDLVSIQVEKNSRTEKSTVNYFKRVVGSSGEKRYKKGRHAWHQVSVGQSRSSQLPISDLRRQFRSQKVIAGFRGTTNCSPETQAMVSARFP